MIEWWLERNYPKLEAKLANSGDLREFDNLWTGPKNEHIAKRIPRRRLEAYLDEGVPGHVEEVIKKELDRRRFSRPTTLSLTIAAISLLMSATALGLSVLNLLR